MNKIISSMKIAFHFLRKDKIVIFLSLFPPFIGGIIYLLVGGLLFGRFKDWGEEWILQNISHEFFGQFLQSVLSVLIFLVLLFIFNWTFVLFLSLISSPFNDALSARVETLLSGKKGEDISQTFKTMVLHGVRNILTEIKKISFILTLTFLALLLGLFPLFAPLSLALSATLCSIQFIDYNWSRHNLPLKSCLKDLRRNYFSYLLSGCFFLFAITIPFINILILPFGVIYFSCLWNKTQHSLPDHGLKETYF